MRTIVFVAALTAAFPGPAPAMQLFHRETLSAYRGVSLVFDPWVCGLWIANEGPQLTLLSLAGTEILRIETPLRIVRAVAVHAQTGTLWIGYDGGRAIAAFDYLPSRDPSAAPLEPGPDCALS